MFTPTPNYLLDYSDMNWIEGHYNPSSKKYLNNDTYNYWFRALFERACSTMEFTLPEDWRGSVKDFFYYALFMKGFLMVTDLPEYGKIFQPVNFGAGRDIFYQPTSVIMTNPYFENTKLQDREFTIHKDCELIKLTPTYEGIFPIISYYAEELSFLKSDVDMATVNAKLAFILGAKTKGAGEAIKKIIDKINMGDIAAVYDQRLTNSPDDKDIPLQFLDLSNIAFKSVDSIEKLLQDVATTMNAFDTEIGIPTMPYQKKERMVVSEAESKVADATSRSIVWYNTLKDSIDIVNKKYDMDISVKLRFDPDDMRAQAEAQAQADNTTKEGSDR